MPKATELAETLPVGGLRLEVASEVVQRVAEVRDLLGPVRATDGNELYTAQAVASLGGTGDRERWPGRRTGPVAVGGVGRVSIEHVQGLAIGPDKIGPEGTSAKADRRACRGGRAGT